MNGKTPVEYQLMGITKEKFSPVDLYNIAGYMAFSFAEAFKADPMFTKIEENLGSEYLNDIIASYVSGTQKIPLFHQDNSENNNLAVLYHVVNQIIEQLPMPFFEGSNSWVLSGSKTESGHVIFANDTHIAYSQPAVWYEAHLECPGFNLYGNFIGGIPFSLLGHNRNLAWGLTMFENDDVDFYSEEINPVDSTKYKSGDNWKPFEVITETIKVKDSADVTITVRKTDRGSVISDINKQLGGKTISVFWTFTKMPSRLMQAFFGMNNAENINDFKTAVEKISSPGLNVMYGDKEGNIAYWAAAKITKFSDTIVHSEKIMSYKNEAVGFYDFSKNPMSVNPPSDFVYSANNQPDTVDGVLYPGYYASEDRAVRILNLLKRENKWTVEKLKTVQTDVTSDNMPETVSEILNAIDLSILKKSENHQIVFNILKSWNGDHAVDSKGPVIYNKLIRKIIELTTKDELGDEDFEFLTHGHTGERSLPVLIKNEHSVWWDNMTTEQKETRKDILTEAYDRMINSLTEELGENTDEWLWGKVHTVEYEHFIGKAVKPLRKIFNVGPFNVWGGKQVINQIGFNINADGQYHSVSGPAMRTLIDFSDIEKKSFSVIPTGQSGIFMSKHYADQVDLYNSGQYRKQMMNKEEIISNSKDVLILKPGK
jgi:penicillin amidase